MNRPPSPLYVALMRALNVNTDSVVATAWGQDYTLGDLDRMSDRQLRATAFKIKSYNLWMKLKLRGVRIQVWFWRNVLEFVVGVKTIFGL